jgi:hypothetical protein
VEGALHYCDETPLANPVDPIDILTGRWRIERRLIDLDAGIAGDFRGHATFAPADDGLGWTEHGRLRLGGHDSEAGRRLAIVPTADGWLVTFEDGRPFHPLDLSGAPVEHRCGDDRYLGEYRVLGPDTLHVTWHVTGPRKDQRIDSSYHRCYCD